ncbi:hypothetical protein [Actinoplanes sp. M2I2]|jgi:hypothetical protein|uniref:hypothetical protein n=1 Tax=Actinoplanes sp. M2I2 TaxID=1734444 RepID=UPI002021EE0A|nr:hypothetical protein [Actinoplanes sp. M2I2]
MASWILVPCLARLRSDFNAIAPSRDRASDGSVGDLAHQGTQSDHNPDETGNVPIRDADRVNEVHAIDIDADLRVPGLSMEAVVQFLLGRCRSGAEKRLRYIIYNRRIWEASNGWRQTRYTGGNPHDKHAHFSGSYNSSLEASTASWHLEDIPVALTAADKNWIRAEINKVDENVRTTARTNKEFLSDTEKDEIIDRTAAALRPEIQELSRRIEDLAALLRPSATA